MKTYNWHKVAGTAEEIIFNSNNIAVVEVNAKKICIARHDNIYFAFAHKCPHAGSIMANGWIDAKGNIVCPLHGFRFDLKNGRNVTGEGYKLKHWPVESRQDGIYIGMEDELFSWL